MNKYDRGALIALERNDRRTWAVLRIAADEGGLVQVPTGAIAQAWRDGARQAPLARALQHCDEAALDGLAARAAGLLRGRTGTSDVVDASVVVAAAALGRAERVTILTSDPDDINHLVEMLDLEVNVQVAG